MRFVQLMPLFWQLAIYCTASTTNEKRIPTYRLRDGDDDDDSPKRKIRNCENKLRMGNSQWAYCTLDCDEYIYDCIAHVHGYKESQKQLDNFSSENREKGDWHTVYRGTENGEWRKESERVRGASREMCQYRNRYLKLQTQKQIATYYKCNMSQTSIFISMRKMYVCVLCCAVHAYRNV